MLGPISNIHVGRPSGVHDVPYMPGASGADFGMSQVNNSPVAGVNIFASVAQLLEGVGGGVETDRNLQALISLLVLLALMQSAQQNLERTKEALSGLGRGAGNRSEYSAYYSSTTIELQFTTTTIQGSAADTYNASSQTQPSQPQIDLAA